MDYYNEIDPFACDWLELLINAKEIPAGHVDRRDIRDIKPSDLRGYRHCHFFAGIGGWARALQIAGWPAHRKVWTGSCPCQPFSAAGKGGGFDDERHLWPAFFHLIQVERPELVVGEQVASKDGLAWLDLVHADLEGQGYTVGASDLCAAGAGAPHIRQRSWWVGIAPGSGRERVGGQPAHLEPGPAGEGRMADTGRSERGQGDTRGACDRRGPGERGQGAADAGEHLAPVVLADAQAGRRDEGGAPGLHRRDGDGPADGGSLGHAGREGLPLRQPGELPGEVRPHQGRAAQQPGRSPTSGILVDADREGWEPWRVAAQAPRYRPPVVTAGRMGNANGDREEEIRGVPGGPIVVTSGGPWSSTEWLSCRDGKARPTQPGLFPLAASLPGRVGVLRGAGNAIVPEVAAAFLDVVEQVLEGNYGEDIFGV